MAAAELCAEELYPTGSQETPTVCVTGASGFCASWLVMRLLQRGYKVRASVRDPENTAKTAHLCALPGAAERLEIVKGDLLDQRDFDAAVSGCEGVFHVATPTITRTDNPDPERDVIHPAVQGTVNVLKACAKSPSVRRVVYTSSAAAVFDMGKELPPDYVFDESCWTSVEFCKEKRVTIWPYVVSKTLAEQKAFEFAKQNNIDLVSIIPTWVLGAFVTPEIPASVRIALGVLTGELGEPEDVAFLRRMSYVDVDDLAMAHIFLYESPSAEGRYICSGRGASIDEVAEILRQRHPELKVPKEFGSIEGHSYSYSSEKIIKLGFKYKCNLEDMYDHAIECCKQRKSLRNLSFIT